MTTRRGPAIRVPFITLALLALRLHGDAAAQTRRALLIGINGYEHTAYDSGSGRALITSLDGSVSDAEAMRDLLVARYSFDASHIRLLKDTAATRQHILDAIKRLADESQPGDVVVFFYAGHGSQRRNSLSKPTQLDQTIVPVDANAGVFDIRNKELAQLFGPLAMKGVTLTLIFDSCHRGAIARGLAVTYKERWAAVDPRDAADSVRPPAPEEHGALVLSSAQDYQTAGETKDDAGVPHGVFTSALLTVLRESAPDEPASRIFQRVKAMMQSMGRPQEPVIAGKSREHQPFLGGAPGAALGVTTVAVLRPGRPGELELQGGPAIGLRESAELAPFSKRPGIANVRLRVIKVLGLSNSTAQVIAGTADSVRAGDLFQIDKWAPSPSAGLTVWIPPAGLDSAAVAQLASAARELRRTPGVEWVDDPSDVPADSVPLALLQWSSGKWTLDVPGRPSKVVAQPLTAASVDAALNGTATKVRVFGLLPPSRSVRDRLELGRGTRNDLVDVVADRSDANYLLVGRVRAGRVEYAWVRPNASREMSRSSTLPIRTDWTEGVPAAPSSADSTAAGQLVDEALRLAKIRSWLEMEGPPDRGRYPYHLALRDLKTKSLLATGPVYGDEWYGLVIHADSEQLRPSLEQRRVYVFVIDSHGGSVLLFPQSNVQNRLPYEQLPNGRWPTEVKLGDDSAIYIRPPFGMDTYVLLTSDEVVPADALEWDGVMRGGMRGGGSALESLLRSNSGATRAAGAVVPMNWSIERLSILSAAKPAKN